MLSTQDNVINNTDKPHNTWKSDTGDANPKHFLEKSNLLTEAETRELSTLEDRVERGLKAFWEIGQALSQIQAKRLYRQEYKTFEEYCHKRWEMSRRAAYQLMNAAIVMENVRNCAQKLPLNEAQVRPLVALPPEKQREAWNKAVSTAPNGKITATHVYQVVKEYQQIGGVKKRKNGASQPPSPHNETADVVAATESHSLGVVVDTYLLPTKSSTRSCWNCQHCSKEALSDQTTFYCFELGILNYLEKNGDDRGATCEFWSDRLTDSEQRVVENQETFTIALRLPAIMQPLLHDAARASSLTVVDWVTNVLLVAASKDGNALDWDASHSPLPIFRQDGRDARPTRE